MKKDAQEEQTQSRSRERWGHLQTCKNTNMLNNCYLNCTKEQGVKMSFLWKTCDNQNMLLHRSRQVHILMQCYTSLFGTHLKMASSWLCIKQCCFLQSHWEYWLPYGDFKSAKQVTSMDRISPSSQVKPVCLSWSIHILKTKTSSF